MSEYVKLTEPGASATFLVTGVTVNTQGEYPDYVFTAQDGTKYQAPKAALDRQLERLKTTAEGLIGSAVTLSRSTTVAKNKRPYWNLDLASPRAATAAPSKRVDSPYRPPTETAPPRQAPSGGASFIPGLDDAGHDDDGPPDWSDVPAPDDAAIPQPPLTPRETAETLSKVAKRKAFADYYAKLYAHLLGQMLAAHNALLRDPTMGQHFVELTSEAVQAATATCIIQMDRKGLLP